MQSLQQGRLRLRIGQLHIHDVDEKQFRLACVDAALENRDRRDILRRQRQAVMYQGVQVGGHMVQRQFEFGQADHGVACNTAVKGLARDCLSSG